jgi:hypothetical protein
VEKTGEGVNKISRGKRGEEGRKNSRLYKEEGRDLGKE